MEAVTRLAQQDAGDLVASAAAGDEYAFRRIIAAHHDDMRRVCMYVAGNRAIADEATQAAWVIAWKKISTVRDPDRLRPWLMAVAVNEAKQLLRKRHRRAEIEIATDASREPGGRDPATGVSGIDLRSAMSRLDPADRELIAMRYVAGFDSNELAIATGKKPGTVRQRLRRLLDRLREDLNDV
jgi:RNA polymerase sigma-70 factor (ECF subfamily)